MVKNIFLVCVTCLALAGCASNIKPTQADVEDVELLVSNLEGKNGCDVSGVMPMLDDEIFIKMMGSTLLKSGVPKAETPLQQDFIKLALESKKTPSGGDKKKLMDWFLFAVNDRCMGFSLGFKNPVLRSAVASSYRKNIKISEEIKSDKLTYEQIAVAASYYDGESDLRKIVDSVLRNNRQLRSRFYSAQSISINKLPNALRAYDFDPSDWKK